jgi:hypothetical protein
MAAAQDPDVIAQMAELNVPYDAMDSKTCQETFNGYYESIWLSGHPTPGNKACPIL